jgi:ABC-type bacteriocin/lantibiotic exporter with double-glycine peptidase domain
MADSSYSTELPQPGAIRRFVKLLSTERREIWYIFIYAILTGIISLSLPLGVQSLIGFVSSGQIVTSVIILMIFIILGVLITGGLQIMQLSLVEHLQQRLFVKTAFEFAYRFTYVHPEKILNHYPPELVNRFFDVLTVQKGLSKMLLEFSAAILQILFGLILLSFYHPYFIFFGLVLIAILAIIFRFTSEQGMKTSLVESKYKYKLVAWLEDVARTLNTFKLGGESNLVIEKTDDFSGNYIQARKKHFKVLLTQYISFVGFKTLITGGLLILGSLLLLNQEINLGQFVASEIIIILTINAVEKVLLKLDVVYDMLTSTIKLGAVMDLPVDVPQGIRIDELPGNTGFAIRLKGLSYCFPDDKKYTLRNINLSIAPGERVCIAGYGGSGKTTLLRTMLGLLPSYEGVITYDKISLRDLNHGSLLNHIGEDVAGESLFEGSILENLTLSHENAPIEDIRWALDCVGLTEFVFSLPQGLHTVLIGGGRQLPRSVASKMALARTLVRRPRLLVLDDFMLGLESREKTRILERIAEASAGMTVVLSSNDKQVMQWCHRTIVLQDGQLVGEGNYEEISQSEDFAGWMGRKGLKD